PGSVLPIWRLVMSALAHPGSWQLNPLNKRISIMLRRLGIIFGLGLILVLIAPAVSAQTCNMLLLAADIGDFADQIENTDPAEVADVLDDMERWIAQQRSACVPRSTDTGLQARPGYEAMYSFTSDEYGNETALGPI